MKNFLLLSTTAVLFSCETDKGEGTTYTYKVVNNSGEPVRIKSYFSSAPDNYKVFFGQNRRRDSVLYFMPTRNNKVFERATLCEEGCR